MEQSYVLPNRKAFADSIVRIFLKYKNKVIDPLDLADSEEDLCKRQGDMSRNSRELLEHQKIVKEYLMTETPYRGLLLYHGLGSGKTCSSIAVAESLLSTRHTYVLLPAALQDNYRKEIRKCGDPIYKFEQHWELKTIRSIEDREIGKAMGISDEFLDRNLKFYTTAPNKSANFSTLSRADQVKISQQLDDVLNQRFTFINYDGILKSNIDKILPPDQPHMFDNSTVIIDEAHNFIGAVVNDSEARQLSGEYSLVKAAKKIMEMGPKYVIIKKGEHGALLFHENQVFFAPALPLEEVFDPTGAGDTFAGGFVAHLAKTKDISFENMKTAIILGSAMASFCVEKFGTQRLTEINAEDIKARVASFVQLVNFDIELV
jgi:hypothetical protein